MRWESKKKSTYSLEFQFLRPRACLTNPFRTLSLRFGAIDKTPGLISRNNVVKKIFVCIGHRDNVLARCDSIFPLLGVKECGTKRAYNFLFPKSSFRIRRTTVFRMFKDSAIILDAIRRSFLTNSATAAMFTSVRVDFGWALLSSSPTSSLPSRNQNTTKKCLIGSEPHSYKPFAPTLVFLSQIDRLWNKILWQLSVHFRHPWHIKKTDFTRQVITRALSKIKKNLWSTL
jgi:hypothetical protein